MNKKIIFTIITVVIIALGAVVAKLGSQYEIMEASEGESGLALALKKHPDLIILDIVMPKMDGLTLLARLREDSWGKTAKVILLTNLEQDNVTGGYVPGDAAEVIIKSDWKIAEIAK